MSEHPAKKRKLNSLQSVATATTTAVVPFGSDSYLPNLEKNLLSKLGRVRYFVTLGIS